MTHESDEGLDERLTILANRIISYLEKVRRNEVPMIRTDTNLTLADVENASLARARHGSVRFGGIRGPLRESRLHTVEQGWLSRTFGEKKASENSGQGRAIGRSARYEIKDQAHPLGRRELRRAQHLRAEDTGQQR